MDIWFWVVAVLAALLVGGSKGGVPIVGMLAVPVLALQVPAVTAAGLLLPIYVVSDVFGLYAYRREYDARNLMILVPAVTIGIAAGWATASLVPPRAVDGLVGLVGVAFALSLLLRRGPEGPARPADWPRGLFWGALAGFTSFVSHAGAPPYQVYVLPQRLEKMVFAGTTTILFAYVNAAKLIPYYALGQLSPANLKIAATLAVPSVLAVFAGVWLVRRLPERLFFQLVTWALLLISVRLLWGALT